MVINHGRLSPFLKAKIRLLILLGSWAHSIMKLQLSVYSCLCPEALSSLTLSSCSIPPTQPHPLRASIPCLSQIFRLAPTMLGKKCLSAAFAKLDCMSLGRRRAIFPGCMKKLCLKEKKRTNVQRMKSSEAEPEWTLRICETLDTAEPVSPCTSQLCVSELPNLSQLV